MTQNYTLKQIINNNPNGENLDIGYLSRRLQYAMNSDETPEALKLAIRDYLEKNIDFVGMSFFEYEYVGAYFAVYMDRYEKRQGAREAFNFLRMFSVLVENTPRTPAPTLAERITAYLNNEEIAEDRRDSLFHYLGAEMVEMSISAGDEELLPYSIPVLLERFEPENLEEFNKVVSSIIDEGSLWSYQAPKVVFTEQTEEKPLDLSEIPAPSENDCIDLARHLSAVLKSPHCPDKLHEVISDQIGCLDQPQEFFTSPEYLAQVLCANDEVSE